MYKSRLYLTNNFINVNFSNKWIIAFFHITKEGEVKVSPTDNYKKAESKVVEKMGGFFKLIGVSIINFFKFIIQKGKQRFTIMFIPHSEKKIVNFHISIFLLVFMSALVIVMFVGFFAYSTYFSGSKEKFNEVTLELEEYKGNIDNFENEVKDLTRSALALKKQMNELLKELGKEVTDSLSYTGEGGDLSRWNLNNDVENSSPQLTELREFRKYVDNIIEPLEKIDSFFERQKELLVNIPNLWPVKGGLGRLTAYFGPEEHPFTHTFRLHNAVDIAWTKGTPLVSTADGVVEAISYNANGLGNNVTIRHKYGFVTRYGHLEKSIVQRGQRVKRGSVIGYMGSTGLSTGPHIHYEVWIGDQVVDPIRFLDMNKEIVDKIR